MRGAERALFFGSRGVSFPQLVASVRSHLASEDTRKIFPIFLLGVTRGVTTLLGNASDQWLFCL